MKSLIIKQEKYNPFVSFNVATNIFDITGESYSENAFAFYQTLLKWLEEYFKINKNPIIFNFQLTYFNTSSSQAIYHILEMLDGYMLGENIAVHINWYAKDASMLEDGYHYQDNFENLTFNIESFD